MDVLTIQLYKHCVSAHKGVVKYNIIATCYPNAQGREKEKGKEKERYRLGGPQATV